VENFGNKTSSEFIGTGYLGIDRTLILRLRREEEGCRFDDELSYAPNSPHYESIRRYIGPVKPNSVFSVSSFTPQ
jgi:hypothetical protein